MGKKYGQGITREFGLNNKQLKEPIFKKMKQLFFLFYAIIFATSICISQTPRNYFDESIKVDSKNIPFNRKQFYFPVKLFPKVEMNWEQMNDSVTSATPKIYTNEIDSIHLTWFSRFLYDMKEPLLFNRQLNKQVFRFTWLRTFHNPVMVRIEKGNNGVFLYWKVTDGKGGYDPGKIMVNEKRKIINPEWEQFISLVDSAKFWKMTRSGIVGMDGSEWILEGIDPTRYYVTSAWSPNKTSSFYKVGDFLLGLTDLNIEEGDKY